MTKNIIQKNSLNQRNGYFLTQLHFKKPFLTAKKVEIDMNELNLNNFTMIYNFIC